MLVIDLPSLDGTTGNHLGLDECASKHKLIKFKVDYQMEFSKQLGQVTFQMQLVEAKGSIYLWIKFSDGSKTPTYSFEFTKDQKDFVFYGYMLLLHSGKCVGHSYLQFDKLKESEKERYSKFGEHDTDIKDNMYSVDIAVSKQARRFLQNRHRHTVLIQYPTQFRCKIEDMDRCLSEYKYEFSPYLDCPLDTASHGNAPYLNYFMGTKKKRLIRFEITNSDFNTLYDHVWLNDSVVKFYHFWITKSNKNVCVLEPLWNSDRQKDENVVIKNLEQKGINLFEFPLVLSTYVKSLHWQTVAIVNHHLHLLDEESDKKCCFLLMDSLYDPAGKSDRTRCGPIKNHITFLSKVLHKHAQFVKKKKGLESLKLVPCSKFRSDVSPYHVKGEKLYYYALLSPIIMNK